MNYPSKTKKPERVESVPVDEKGQYGRVSVGLNFLMRWVLGR